MDSVKCGLGEFFECSLCIMEVLGGGGGKKETASSAKGDKVMLLWGTAPKNMILAY